jgi:hypothetical protein
MTLLFHISRLAEHGELCNKWLERLNVWEGHTFWHLPSGKRDEDHEPAKVELIALILSFATIQFELVN